MPRQAIPLSRRVLSAMICEVNNCAQAIFNHLPLLQGNCQLLLPVAHPWHWGFVNKAKVYSVRER